MRPRGDAHEAPVGSSSSRCCWSFPRPPARRRRSPRSKPPRRRGCSSTAARSATTTPRSSPATPCSRGWPGSPGASPSRSIADPAALTPARLAASDIVLWNSTTGAESPFSDAQEAAYMSWVGCGGGHMGVHASTDSYRDWPGWAELTGAFFKIHPLTPTSIADDRRPSTRAGESPAATILVKDQDSPITAPWHGRDRFVLRDEYYALDRDPAKTISDYRVTLAFGGFTDPLVTALYGSNYAREQPLAWTGSYRGKNRISYTNLGHSPATWNRGDFQDSLVESIAWVAAKRPSAPASRPPGWPDEQRLPTRVPRRRRRPRRRGAAAVRRRGAGARRRRGRRQDARRRAAAAGAHRRCSSTPSTTRSSGSASRARWRRSRRWATSRSSSRATPTTRRSR